LGTTVLDDAQGNCLEVKDSLKSLLGFEVLSLSTLTALEALVR